MKYISFLALLLFSIPVFTQDKDSLDAGKGSIYYENNYELLFQFGFIETSKMHPVKMRFSGFYHTEETMHFDFARRLGFYTGIGVRNIGMVEHSLVSDEKMKRRTYTIGIPLALKIGSMKTKRYLYVGTEMEVAFHYKQKLFVPEMKKRTFTEWFSPRVNAWQPSIFAGLKFSEYWSLRMKYYLHDFINSNFVGRDFDKDVDYSNYISSNLFYVALVFNLSKERINKAKNAPMRNAEPVGNYTYSYN